MKHIIPLLLLQLLLFMSGVPTHAQRTKSSLKSGEQRKAEKGLKDNRYFFYFINSSVTNFGTDEEKKRFKEAVQRDIISQLLYMRFMFPESYGEIRKTQKILIDLYRATLLRDIDASRELLNQFAPVIINFHDNTAIEYLRLGYRDLKVAQTYLTMADNFREKLYSMKLYKYVHAIKNAKHGKRYGFVAMLLTIDLMEVQREASKYSQYEFTHQILDTKARIKGISFEDLEKRLTEIPPPDKREYYRTVYLDSYYRTNIKKSLYDEIWEQPHLNEIKEYQEYLNE